MSEEIQSGRPRSVPQRPVDYRQIVQSTILEHSTPAVLVDQNYDVLYFHGDTTRFLAPPIGEPRFNILQMMRGGIAHQVMEMVDLVIERRKPTRLENIDIVYPPSVVRADIEGAPVVVGVDNLLCLIRFLDRSEESEGEATEVDARVTALEQELFSTKQDLQATIEELETSNEELKSANEEQQANMEELQSTNEELETSREELQSTNEELEGLNIRLQKNNEDLYKANDDIKNLFEATDVGTLFLDTDFSIKRFNPAVRFIFNLIPDDIGRPIWDINSRLDYSSFQADSKQVLETLHAVESRVKDTTGRTYHVRIRPYRTSENVIEGLVVTFEDVTNLEHAEARERQAQTLVSVVAELIDKPLVCLDRNNDVTAANDSFCRASHIRRESLFGMSLKDALTPDAARTIIEYIKREEAVEGSVDFDTGNLSSSLGGRVIIHRAESSAGESTLTVLIFPGTR